MNEKDETKEKIAMEKRKRTEYINRHKHTLTDINTYKEIII